MASWLASYRGNVATHPSMGPVAAYYHSVATDDASSISPQMNRFNRAIHNQQQMVSCRHPKCKYSCFLVPAAAAAAAAAPAGVGGGGGGAAAAVSCS